ncbi:hypothetical protein PN499_13590 [Kamptonema animale CS-326]|uniref:hypothetical protein n=1 Tax=Kamptonema animale TaxID=92934 RepID=UPI00232E9148|nr:hypothetical protein [Kamptonema animale]MDB9512220.1 hypothetical protein [Kamptonema animale CS-326]
MYYDLSGILYSHKKLEGENASKAIQQAHHLFKCDRDSDSLIQGIDPPTIQQAHHLFKCDRT